MQSLQRVTAGIVLLTLWCAGCATVEKAPVDARLVEAQGALEQGKRLQEAGKYAQAVPLMERALALRRATLGPGHLEVAEVLNDLGDLYFSQGQYARAESSHQQALDLRGAELGLLHPKVGVSLSNLAAVYLSQGQHARARELAERALTLLEAALGPDHPEVANTLSTLAILHRLQGQYTQAERLYIRALAIREAALGKDHLSVAPPLNNLAFFYQAQGRYAQAELLHKRALTIREAALGKDHPDIAFSRNNLAVLYYAQGRYTLATEQLEQALKIQEALGRRHPSFIRSLNNLSQIYHAQGQYMRAEPLLEQVLAAQEETFGPTHIDVATALNNLALLYQSQGQYARTLRLLQQALDIRKAVLGPHHPDVAFSLNNLAGLHQLQGQGVEAERMYQEALAIFKEALGPDHPSVALSLHNLAVLHQRHGRYSQAEPPQRQALAIYEKALGSDHPDVARARSNLATIHADQGRYTQAEPLYEQALAIYEKALGPGHPDVFNTLANFARLRLAQRRLPEALLLFERALSLSEEHLRTQALVLSEERLASFLQVLNQQEQLLYALLRAHPEDPRVRRLVLATALLRKGRSAEELANIYRTICRSLSAEDQDTCDQLRALRARIASKSLAGPGKLAPADYRQNLKELADQADVLETRLARNSAPLRALRALPPAEEIVDHVAGTLTTNSALVEFIAYDAPPLVPKPGTPYTRGPREPRYLALVLSPEGRTGAVDLGPAALIDQAVLRLRELLSKRATAYPPAAQELYRLVFRPLLPLLGNTHHLFLSPDGQLSLVPFDALHDGKAFLADRFDLSYLNSGKDLLPLPEGVAPSQSVVVLADPDFGAESAGPSTEAPSVECPPFLAQSLTPRQGLADQPWPRLPCTRQEAMAILRLLPQAELLLGAAATKQALLRLKAPGLLHIATHGFFLEDATAPTGTRGVDSDSGNSGPVARPADPLLRSGLVLAGARAPNGSLRNEDSLVTALELSGMDLWGTQLVVLSACDTGRGDIKPGQGVYGLRRALGVAGAETVVMSLWKVNDETTRQLMEDYYQHLLAGQGRAQALRESMRALRLQHPHPYYWASFIAVGQDTPLRGLTRQAQAQP